MTSRKSSIGARVQEPSFSLSLRSGYLMSWVFCLNRLDGPYYPGTRVVSGFEYCSDLVIFSSLCLQPIRTAYYTYKQSCGHKVAVEYLPAMLKALDLLQEEN